VLDAVPGSRLIVLTGAPIDSQADRQFRPHFARHGLSGDRVQFVGQRPSPDYFRFLHQIDVGLDTHPYGGCTTTCDALWMGVPTVTVTGDRYAGRCGLSLLSAVGLADLAPVAPESFVAASAFLAQDVQRRTALRRSLREHLSQSVVMNYGAFQASWLSACRATWRGVAKADGCR
jgi:predicted O-linked N-acetylglucosamine transferase (SPINDLY family)